MPRKKGSKNKEAGQTVEAQVEQPSTEQAIPAEENVLPVPEEKKTKEQKEEPLVLVKTADRDVVAVAIKLKYDIVHISGYGTIHNPKIFFMNVQYSKLSDEVGEGRMENVDAADRSEIAQLIKASRERGAEEEAKSGAKKRKLNSEIEISEFYN